MVFSLKVIKGVFREPVASKRVFREQVVREQVVNEEVFREQVTVASFIYELFEMLQLKYVTTKNIHKAFCFRFIYK